MPSLVWAAAGSRTGTWPGCAAAAGLARGPDRACHSRGRSRPPTGPLRTRNSSRIGRKRASRPAAPRSLGTALADFPVASATADARVRGGVMSSERRIDVSSVQVAASVMAAVTGALAASFLGVAGTIIGTAMMSVAGTVGVALYRYFLDRSREKIHSAASAKIQPLAHGRGVPAVLGHHQVTQSSRTQPGSQAHRADEAETQALPALGGTWSDWPDDTRTQNSASVTGKRGPGRHAAGQNGNGQPERQRSARQRSARQRSARWRSRRRSQRAGPRKLMAGFLGVASVIHASWPGPLEEPGRSSPDCVRPGDSLPYPDRGTGGEAVGRSGVEPAGHGHQHLSCPGKT